MVASLERWVGKVAVVTGASGGIGSAIVEQMVDAGIVVVGIDLRKEIMEDLAKKLQDKKGKLYALRADVTKEEDILEAFQWVRDNVGPIHILVNNVGIMRRSNLIDGSTKLWKEVLDINVMALCIATREAVKDMRTNKVVGHIIHICSVAGHHVRGMSTTNIYGASKHAVYALTETLRQELNSIGSKIKISSVSPGAVRTGIFQAAVIGSGLTELRKSTVEFLEKAAMLNAEDIADAVMYCLATPPHVQVHNIMVKPVGELI